MAPGSDGDMSIEPPRIATDKECEDSPSPGQVGGAGDGTSKTTPVRQK